VIQANSKLPGRQLIAPVLTLICLAAMFLLGWLWPLVRFARLPFNLAGLLLAAAGLSICLAGQRQFRKAGTTLYPFSQPARLVTDGLFRYTRNPMYLGLAAILVGAWLFLGSLSPAGVVIAFLSIADRWYVANEERRLLDIFGKAHEAYCARTPRWLWR
jgi:protein-S-isoprenylcysteine O-methyltransferase Ste14